jgi:uncharacterized protein (TIRG00374 family)
VKKTSFFKMTWFSWLLGLALLILLAVVVTHLTEEHDFILLIEKARLEWLIASFIFQVGTYLADARIWQQILQNRQIYYPLKSCISFSIAKLFMDQAVPSGGVSGTLLIVGGLKKRNVPSETTASTLVIAAATYYIAYALALLLGLVVLWGEGNLTYIILIPAGIFMIFIASAMTFFFKMKRSKIASHFWSRIPFVKNLSHIFDSIKPEVIRNPLLLTQCTLLQLSIFILDSVTLWTCLKALGINPSLFAVFASYMISSLARTMGFMPAGLGTFEAASVASLKMMKIPIAAALSGTLLFRGLSFWLPMIPGLILAQRLAHQKPTPEKLP